MAVDRRQELASFLRTKRGQVSVRDTPLALGGSRRRVPGLRREEVAELAHISLTYYTRLERARVASISGVVLDGIGRALHLTPEERAYVTTLIPISGEIGRTAVRHDLGDQEVVVTRLLDALGESPAYVLNPRCDIVAANARARALYRLHLEEPASGNTVRFLFLDPRARDFYEDWQLWADEAVQYLRATRARYPSATRVDALIHELHEVSEAFRETWQAHEVTYRAAGSRLLHHPEAGDLELEFLNLEIPELPGLRLTVYSAAPGSDAEAGLRRLRLSGRCAAALSGRCAAALSGSRDPERRLRP